MIALCGQGVGCELVLAHLLLLGTKLQVYTHPGLWGERMVMQAARGGMPGTYASINDREAWQYSLPPSLIISCGYLTILDGEMLASAPAINCHYALLPLHRGRSAVPWAIIDGDRVTGVSWHWMTEGIDKGNLLIQAVCEIEPQETQASLFDQLHQMAGETFPAALRLARAEWPGAPQRGRGSYHYAGPPCGGVINPMWDDSKVERFIRAMIYPPLAPATLAGREVRTMDDFYTIANEEGDHVYVF